MRFNDYYKRNMRSILLALMALPVLDAAAMQVSLTPGHPHCGLSNGSITTFVYNGPVPPYTYLWNTGDTTATIDGLPPGTYSVTVTDATNATATGTVTLQNVSTLNFPTSPVYLQDCFMGGCEATFTWPIANFMGTPPYTYSPQPTSSSVDQVDWALCYLGQINQDIPFLITDANGCTAGTNMSWLLQSGWMLYNYPLTLPSCNGGANGQVTFQVQYADLLSTNSITVLNASNEVVFASGNYGDIWNTTIVVPGLLPGEYHTLITSTLPYCSPLNYPGPNFTIADMGVDCGTVTGDLFVDADDDCVQDGSEAVVPFALMAIQPGNEITFTDVHGHYIHNLQYGNYTIEHADPNYVQQCPAVSPIPFVLDGSPQTVNIDIADSSLYGHDVEVTLSSGPARPGFMQNVWVDVWNRSTYPSGDLSLSLDFDQTVQFITASVVPDQVNSSSLQWDLGTLAVYGHQQIHLQFQVPPDVGLIGYELLTTATLSNTATETNTVNNVFTRSTIITGSLDPNDKLVRTSSGTSAFQYFNDLDEYVEYTIRFQNTGTDTAFTVVVRDTISEVFDLLTTEIIASSHAMTADVRNPRVLTFTFSNIELPDSNTNEPASHGFVTFRIRPSLSITPGTVIANTANIYFDFNPPVITAPSLLVAEFSTGVPAASEEGLHVFPNPARDRVLLMLPSGADRSFALHAADGRAVRVVARPTAMGLELDVAALPPGLYTVRMAQGSARFVKQ